MTESHERQIIRAVAWILQRHGNCAHTRFQTMCMLSSLGDTMTAEELLGELQEMANQGATAPDVTSEAYDEWHRQQGE